MANYISILLPIDATNELLNLPLVAFPCYDNIIDEPEYYFDSVHSQ